VCETKNKKENEEIKKMAACILGLAREIWYADSPTRQASLWQIWFYLDKRSPSYKNVKITRFLPFCQYTHGVVHQLLESHDTLLYVLILVYYCQCSI